MKILIKTIPYLFYFVGGLLIITPFILWFRSPELTQMEMFKEYWSLYFVAIIFILMANEIIKRKS